MNIKKRLSRSNQATFSIYAMLAAFCTYSCMYAFRKPFAVATFADLSFLNIDYKIWLITAQVLGYTASKFLGIKIISELKGNKRHLYILLLILIAEVALLLFAIIPPPYNIIFLFLNGLPLGMVWGIVFSYLEGRRTTELLGAGLCVSFIFSSGFVKSAGKWLMVDVGISQFWMPFWTGMIFVIPLILSVFMLNNIPEPNVKDQLVRSKRVPMNGKERMKMIRNFSTGLTLLIFAYMVLTAFRDFRDNFAAEMWKSLGHGSSPEVFTLTEIPISLCILVIMGLMILVKNNFKALMINHLLVISGFFIIGCSTFLFEREIMGPVSWVTFVGLGLYMGYVPFNSIFFERMIAAFRSAANVGFLIYLADSFGYLGSVGVMFYKNFSYPNISWLAFFKTGTLVVSLVGMIMIVSSMIYFYQKYKRMSAAPKNIELDIALENS